MPNVSTCSPPISPGASGRGSVRTPIVGFMQGALSAGRICTGLAPWLVKVRTWGRLASLTASAPKSSWGVEGTIALKAVPVMGTAKAVLLSALAGLLTVNVAFRGSGHADGGTPASTVEGNHGQLC